ncbi:sensor histidine kinase [Catalinimonas niigatensis]|uniref:sensor histidine kinase n=1 Tax=Catalinimonas niigatensis TaxID=1397264 RepID=UPI002665BF93|nr:histidine kinase [Catalinimonas niigatensis]WPP51761.1 histidine kinase [Catalinimonas niigatensis]
MKSDDFSVFKIIIPTSECYRHLLVWGVVWIFMVSGGIQVDWPLWFSIWTQTPYVIVFGITFYLTLYHVCPKLHENKINLLTGHLLVGGLFMLLYSFCNRVIPEYGNQWEGILDYPFSEDIVEAMNMLIFIWIPAYGLYYSKHGIALTKRNSLKAIELAQTQEQLARQELQFYKSQFNAHLTFNTLSHIYSKIMEQEEAAQPILLLSEILRYNTATKADSLVKLDTEISYLHNFIQIHKTIYPDLHIIFNIYGDTRNFLMLPRILVNFVENAIKHGVGNDPDFPITITLSANDFLEFKVVNKIRSSASASSTRVGLEITQQTLRAFYHQHHTLKIDQNQAIYSVSLKIFSAKDPVLVS